MTLGFRVDCTGMLVYLSVDSVILKIVISLFNLCYPSSVVPESLHKLLTAGQHSTRYKKNHVCRVDTTAVFCQVILFVFKCFSRKKYCWTLCALTLYITAVLILLCFPGFVWLSLILLVFEACSTLICVTSDFTIYYYKRIILDPTPVLHLLPYKPLSHASLFLFNFVDSDCFGRIQ